MLTPSDKIYLAKSKIAGRGVFAKVPIKENEMIEIAPVLVVPYLEQGLVHEDLKRYVFKWPVSGRETSAIAMGFGSFYNHSDTPNAAYHHSLFDRTLTFVAIKNISQDEEITHNYGYKIRETEVKESALKK